MTVVYPLGNGSVLKNFELRMSLRSIEKHLSGYTDVWIIGEKPDWIQNINHIPFIDHMERPSDYNIMKKISCACEQPEVTESFLMFNDDHFLLSPFRSQTFPYYYYSTLQAHIKKRGMDAYGKRMNNSLQHLLKNDLPTKHFDIHTPIIYNKDLFLKNVTALDWNIPHAYVIKSLYANSLRIEGEEIPDNKVSQPPQRGKIFSTYPHIKASITRFLVEQFPKMSKYERVGI
jgi:hypothetical protein